VNGRRSISGKSRSHSNSHSIHKKPKGRKAGKWIEIINLYHQGNGNTYKKLGVYVSDDFKVILSLTEGEAKGEYTRINFQLSEQELIFLSGKVKTSVLQAWKMKCSPQGFPHLASPLPLPCGVSAPPFYKRALPPISWHLGRCNAFPLFIFLSKQKPKGGIEHERQRHF
jgi:hypothetical protein